MRILLLLFIYWRFLELGLKPVHHDEAVNGQFVQTLWAQGFYNYDPTNFHGPLLIYLMGLSEKIFGWGIESLRLVPVICSALWLWFLQRWTKGSAGRWMVLLLATSSGYLFFSRHAVHEMVFVSFLSLALIGVFEVLEQRAPRGWLYFLWGVWGCLVLKETWAIVAFSGALSLAILFILPRRREELVRVLRWTRFPPRMKFHLALAVGLWGLLFTEMLSRPQALSEFFEAFFPWTKTGVHGAGHEKSFWYWTTMLVKYETPLAVLIFGTVLGALARWSRLSLGTTVLWGIAVIQWLVYSMIPYKTPWCLVSVMTPFVILILTSWKEIFPGLGPRTVLGFTAVVLALYTWPQTSKLNFERPTMEHDYVYVETDVRLKKLVETLLNAAKEKPSLWEARIHIAGSEAWPMAWWLSPFKNVHYEGFHHGIDPSVDLVIADSAEEEQLLKLLDPGLFVRLRFPIRQARSDSVYWVRKSVFPSIQEGDFL